MSRMEAGEWDEASSVSLRTTRDLILVQAMGIPLRATLWVLARPSIHGREGRVWMEASNLLRS